MIENTKGIKIGDGGFCEVNGGGNRVDGVDDGIVVVENVEGVMREEHVDGVSGSEK